MNHLLIVDDNAMDRELARHLVERHTNLQAQFASNGLEALEHLEASTPLAVLTDLQMPEMDGLALVRAMRKRFPTIPVLLMTAYGSEDLALEALVQGAADFIPKHRLASDLPQALENVLGAMSSGRRHDEIRHYLCYQQVRYSFDGKASLIPALVDQMQQTAADFGVVEEGGRARLARCLAEALRNAVTHGCGGASGMANRQESPHVDVMAEFTPSEARFVIRDSGPGFDYTSVVDPRQEPRRLTADSGRGLALIRLFMDEVSFNSAGNEITLVKKRRTGASQELPPARNERAQLTLPAN